MSIRRPFLSRALVFATLGLPLGHALAAPDTGTSSHEESTSEGFQVVDARRRSVAFAELPRRIVVAGRAAGLVANALYLFPEARERVVTLLDGSQQTSASFLALLDPALTAKSVAGGAGAGPEQIAPHHPDLVVLKTVMANRLGEPLERLGLRVVYVESESPEGFLEDLALLGRLLGNETRALQITEYYESRLRVIRERLADLPASGRPRVLFLAASAAGGERAFSAPRPDWLQARLIREAGGQSAAEADFAGGAIVTVEQVAAWRPDRIAVARYRGDSRELVARLAADPVWSTLPAVKRGKLDAFPGDFYSWDQPDPRWILGQLWLAKTIHPERFADLDLGAEVVSFYRLLYGLSEETIRTKVVPQLTGDVAR